MQKKGHADEDKKRRLDTLTSTTPHHEQPIIYCRGGRITWFGEPFMFPRTNSDTTFIRINQHPQFTLTWVNTSANASNTISIRNTKMSSLSTNTNTLGWRTPPTTTSTARVSTKTCEKGCAAGVKLQIKQVRLINKAACN